MISLKLDEIPEGRTKPWEQDTVKEPFQEFL